MPIHNRTIIAIWNTGSQGKTTSIRLAATLLEQRTNVTILSGSVPPSGEISVTLEMNTSLGPVIVCFESQGDPNTSLDKRLQQTVKSNADIIVCATRTSGGTVSAVDNVARRHHYQVLWQSTLTSGTAPQLPLNTIMANHIVSLIDNVVLGGL